MIVVIVVYTLIFGFVIFLSWLFYFVCDKRNFQKYESIYNDLSTLAKINRNFVESYLSSNNVHINEIPYTLSTEKKYIKLVYDDDIIWYNIRTLNSINYINNHQDIKLDIVLKSRHYKYNIPNEMLYENVSYAINIPGHAYIDNEKVPIICASYFSNGTDYYNISSFNVLLNNKFEIDNIIPKYSIFKKVRRKKLVSK